MANKIDVYIGKFKTSIKYSSENEKKALEEISQEINKDFNKLLISFGRIDEKMLMFFMLLNLQKNIFEKTNSNKKDDLLAIFKEVSIFVNQGTVIENNLILGLIFKKNELKKAVAKSKVVDEKEEFINSFNIFFENILEKTLSIGDVIKKTTMSNY